LKRKHAEIHEAHTGIRKSRNRLEKGIPRDFDQSRLIVEYMVVPAASSYVRRDNDEGRDLNKNEILRIISERFGGRMHDILR